MGSGWIFDYIVSFDISIVPYEAIKGSSYIPLPSFIAYKNAVINIKNLHDHKCSLYAVTLALYPVKKNSQRLTQKMIENSKKFNCSGIEFTVTLKDISKFEKQNDINICVIVYDEKQGFYLGKPIGVGVSMSKVIKLLLI